MWVEGVTGVQIAADVSSAMPLYYGDISHTIREKQSSKSLGLCQQTQGHSALSFPSIPLTPVALFPAPPTFTLFNVTSVLPPSSFPHIPHLPLLFSPPSISLSSTHKSKGPRALHWVSMWGEIIKCLIKLSQSVSLCAVKQNRKQGHVSLYKSFGSRAVEWPQQRQQ